METKKIDINQRIPLFVLEIALEEYLNDNYDRDYILEQLQTEFSGGNRLKKSLGIVNKIITNSPLDEILKARKEEILMALQNRYDRNLILIALLNAAYVFSYDTLEFYGKYLSVQELVNTNVIKTSLSNIYGGNRATEIAMYSVVPMFLEAEMIIRPKVGIYKLNHNFKLVSNIAPELYAESFRVHNSILIPEKEIVRHPYFMWVRQAK